MNKQDLDHKVRDALNAYAFQSKGFMDIERLDQSIETFIANIWGVIWRHKFIFVSVSVIVFAGLIAGMLAWKPLYEASTLLIGGQVRLEESADSVRQPAETPVALVQIAESEEVVGEAIAKVGLNDLASDFSQSYDSFFGRLRRTLFPSLARAEHVPSQLEAMLPRIKARLTVRSEPNSSVIRVAYRHSDPVVATRFANALAQSLVDRQILLFSRPGAADFFSRQEQRFEDEAKAAAEELDGYSTKTSIYSSEDQKPLLLKRLNELNDQMAVARGTIAQKIGERQRLAEELRKLAPVTRSRYVSSLVENLGGEREPAIPRTTDERTIDDRSSDPPLLLVRVYQDSMVQLFKINADLAGAENLLKQKADEATHLTKEIDLFAQNEQQFTSLKRAVDRARYNADVYSNKMVEEQITAESRAARLSSVKVLQRATPPLRPVSPNYIVISGMSVLLSGLAGFGAAWLRARRVAAPLR